MAFIRAMNWRALRVVDVHWTLSVFSSRRDEMFIAPYALSNSEPIYGRQKYYAPKGACSAYYPAIYKYFAATRLTNLRHFAFTLLMIAGVIVTHSTTARAA